MHFSTTVASVFTVVLAAICGPISVVSAQSVPVTAACLQCYTIAGTLVSPACTPELLLTNNQPAQMTPQERTCFCLLAETTTDWLLACVKPGACSTENINNVYSGYSAPEFRDTVCSAGGAAPPSTPPPTAPSSSAGPAPLPPSSTSPVVTLTRGTPAVTTTTGSPAAPSSTTSDAAGTRFGGSSQVLTGLKVVIVAAAGALL